MKPAGIANFEAAVLRAMTPRHRGEPAPAHFTTEPSRAKCQPITPCPLHSPTGYAAVRARHKAHW